MYEYESENPEEYKFVEYRVKMVTVTGDKSIDRCEKPVVLSVWARGLDDALTCGEILSAIYL